VWWVVVSGVVEGVVEGACGEAGEQIVIARRRGWPESKVTGA